MNNQFNVHDEIFSLEQKFLEKKQALSKLENSVIEDKEIFKEIIEERMEEGMKNFPPNIEASAKNIDIPKPPVNNQEISSTENESSLILKNLINIAIEKSIPESVKEARKTGNAYLIDKLHDELVDKLYEQMLNKN